ncbi:alpha/beta fold hydrolase [Sphingomonas sp. TX0543]|uniref:alpha/beta fold hydrolase n=1 Tax=unclassified Sphingomonas TaxID=196159 RepID=UPI0010F44B3F|nr:alpha/beta fold hydrolase [Sphingomonas sp. 3P27F8]
MSANESIVESDGGPILVLPGLMCDFSMFADLADRVPALVAVPDYGACDAIGAMADHVLADAPATFGLFGHSMGARVALEVYRRVPDRVTRLALVSTGVHPVQPGEAYKRYALGDLGHTSGMAALVDSWLPPMVAAGARNDTDLMGRLRAMCVGAGLDRYRGQVRALLARPEVKTLLPGITCPVLVACGDADLWSPPDQHRAIAAAIPGARLAIVPGAGHMLPAEAPEALSAILRDWITATTPIRSQA